MTVILLYQLTSFKMNISILLFTLKILRTVSFWQHFKKI